MADSETPRKRIGTGLAGPGRPKGVSNKVTHDLREMVLRALDKVGGEKYLTEQAKENPQAFMTMLGKCLPKDVNLQGDLALTVTVQRLTSTAK